MHANTELFDDVVKLAILLASVLAAAFGAHNHGKLKGIDNAVNGVTDPSSKTLVENVQEMRDEHASDRAQMNAAPPEGQAG